MDALGLSQRNAAGTQGWGDDVSDSAVPLAPGTGVEAFVRGKAVFGEVHNVALDGAYVVQRVNGRLAGVQRAAAGAPAVRAQVLEGMRHRRRRRPISTTATARLPSSPRPADYLLAVGAPCTFFDGGQRYFGHVRRASRRRRACRVRCEHGEGRATVWTM